MVQKIVDDILFWAPSLAALEDRLHKVLQRCSDLHITLSRLKFQIDRSLKFAGCIVSDEGVEPDPDRISALADFPVLTDQTSVQSFLGLCNQLTFFVPDYQHHTVVLRQLTGKGRPFLWLPEHQHEFDTLKQILSGNLVVRHFDPSKNIILLTLAFTALAMPSGTLTLTRLVRNILKLCTVDQRDSHRPNNAIPL